jgi:hypothetical protein
LKLSQEGFGEQEAARGLEEGNDNEENIDIGG